MAGSYTTGQDEQGNWYVYNKGVVPFRLGMLYYGNDTDQFNTLKSQLNGAGGQELWEGYQTAQAQAPSNPTGEAAAPAAPVLNRAAVDNTQATINELPGLLRDALAAEGTRYNNTLSGFNTQEKTQRGTYDKSTTTNQQNYDENFMDSIRAGIHGLSGLMALLRGTGAAGGTVDQNARDIVGGETSNDIRGGKDTRDENQSSLDSTLSTFLSDLKSKRQAADDTLENNQRAYRRDTNTQLQDLYSKMAGYYGDANDTANRDSWMAKAGALTHDIAENSRTQVSKYDNSPIVVHAPNLTAFAPPSQPDLIAPPSDGQVGSGIFTISDRRRTKDEATPTLPALAGA